MITFCIVVVPFILFFIGSSKTSGINSSLLLLSEIIFTLLFTPLIGEKTTVKKIIGALGVCLGSAFILYKGSSTLNIGDLLIIASTITYPIGNFYSKKALNFVSPAIILFVRFLLGGIFISIFAFFVEPTSDILNIISNHWEIMLSIGFVVLGINKILWYEGLKRLDISKAISLSMSFPLFSLLILILFFKQVPTSSQWIGIFIMAIGVYISVKRPSVNPSLTKYASENQEGTK